MSEIEFEILQTINRNRFDACFVKPIVAESLVREVTGKFLLSLNELFIWESYSGNVYRKDYQPDADDWEKFLNKLLISFEDEIFVAITDEEYFPWPVMKCKKNDLAHIISDQRFFEYFIFDLRFNKVVFDTHHNSLILIDTHEARID